jgi:hypothetical protein
VSVKDRLEKQMEDAARQQAEAKARPEAPKPAEDVALKAAQVRVEKGDYAVVRRSQNGALVKTRPYKNGDKPVVLS